MMLLIQDHLGQDVAAYLLLLGLYRAITGRGLIHLVLCLALMEASTYVLLLSSGFRIGGRAPIFVDYPPGTPAVDPVVQSLALTDIVVSSALSALILVLWMQVHKVIGVRDPSQAGPFKG